MKNSSNHRTIIIGDVHGCLDELNALLAKIKLKPDNDSLYFLGDIINRGPCSKGVFLRMQELGGVSVLGNHERAVLNLARKNSDSRVLAELKSEFGAHFESFIESLADWPCFIETDDFILVHAGLIPGISLQKTDPRVLVSIRTWDGIGIDLNNPFHPPWFHLYRGKKLVVFGHWASLEGVIRENAIGLDTGCVYGKRLSALLLPAREIVTVEARKKYHAINDEE